MGNRLKPSSLDYGLLEDFNPDTSRITHLYAWRMSCKQCGTINLVAKTVPYICPYDARHMVDPNVVRIRPKDMVT